MKPTGVHQGRQLEVMPDAGNGWFVCLVEGQFVAGSVVRLGGPVVRSMVFEGAEVADFNLSLLLARSDEDPHAFSALPGVNLSLKNPFDEDDRPITRGSRVTELQPAQVSTLA